MSVNTKVNGQLVKSAGLYKASVPIQSGDIYSFEERRVGVWADGKPLYQRTITIDTIASSLGVQRFAHNIANIETVFAVSGTWLQKSDDSVYIGTKDIIRTDGSGNINVGKGSVGVWVDATNIIIDTTENRSSQYLIVTIQYTKTTDVAGSGEYVPSGDKAEHYSTDEEVIGTWLGETLYRRVFDLGADVSIPNNAFTTTTIDASNMKILVSARALYSTGVTVYNIMANINNNIIRLQADRNDNAISARYVILEYTKTS